MTTYYEQDGYVWKVTEGLIMFRSPYRPHWGKSEYNRHFDEFIEYIVLNKATSIEEVEDTDE
jgi:hypothetical protein